MALSSFQNSAEPIKVYKVLVGAFNLVIKGHFSQGNGP